jgi:hypothetical protein
LRQSPSLTIETLIGTNSIQEESDDSGSDEYDRRINIEHDRLISTKDGTSTPPPPDHENKIEYGEIYPKDEDEDDQLNLSLPEIPSQRPRRHTDVTQLKKHRQEVDQILEENHGKGKKSNVTGNSNRRVSMMDQKRYFVSFQSSAAISTSDIKKQYRRASTGMNDTTQLEKLSSISKEDAALLALAKKSLRRQVTDDDINLLKIALPPEHLAKIHEWSLGADTSIPEEDEGEHEENLERVDKQVDIIPDPYLEEITERKSLHTEIVEEGEGVPLATSRFSETEQNVVNPQDPQDDSPPLPDVFKPPLPSRRKSNKFSLSKEDEELLQLARSSFQTNNTLSDSGNLSLRSDVTDGETLRLLMTIESTRSTSLEPHIPSTSIAEKIRKLSPADEALLMLARHSIHPVASDSGMLSEYLIKTSELYSVEELKRDENIGEEENEYEIDDSRHDRGSMISLKDIHRNALLNAFQSICQYPIDTDPHMMMNIAHDGYLTYEKFLTWEQIQTVLTQQILTEAIVQIEFQNMAHSSEQEENLSMNKIIKFDEFCDLMERLEILAEERTTDLNSPHEPIEEIEQHIESTDDHAGIPTDIRNAYTELIATQYSEDIGVTLESLLQWNQLQNAISEQLLSKEDVEHIFQTISQTITHLDLSQFYQVSLELQKKIDHSIGDLNALDKLAVPVMDEQMRLEALPDSFSQHHHHPSRPFRRGSYRETLGDNLEIYPPNTSGAISRPSKQRNMSIHSSQSFESSIQDTFDQPNFLEVESELSKIVITGHLYKQGGKIKNWKKRKFILKGCRLSYYDTRKLKGEFNTRDCEVKTIPSTECNGSQYGFMITGPGRNLLLYANNDEDRMMWIEGIQERIEEQERLSQWEDQLNQMNKYQEEYERTHPKETEGENDVNGLITDGSDDDDDDDGMWKIKHSIQSLVVDGQKGGDQKEEFEQNQRMVTGNENTSIWDQFLDLGEVLLCSGEIIKRNKYGLSQKRQLLLAKQSSSDSSSLPPRLFYVDPSSMRVKGEMEWDNQKTPQAEYVSDIS